MTLEKYILDIVKNDLSLNLDNIEPRRKLFEYPKTFVQSKILDTELQNLFQKEVVIKTDTKTCDYLSNLFTKKARMESIQQF